MELKQNRKQKRNPKRENPKEENKTIFREGMR